uniref:Putative ovule protein n=1 Tax=Solanum chacoense TaxID=4108 RepID=A0A0V0HX20_SOLCH
MSYRITPTQYFFGLPLPLRISPTANLSHRLTGAQHISSAHAQTISVSFPSSCLPQRPLTFSRITSFLILSLLVCPHIQRNILISAICIF